MDKKTPRLKPVHRSTSDWDFNSTRWQLNATTYVSPPSCLEIIGSTALPRDRVVLCRAPAAYALDEGRLVTYLKRAQALSSSHLGFSFRNQSPLGAAVHTNSYKITIFHLCHWYYVTAGGADVVIAVFDIPDMSSTAWGQYRITWWNGTDPTEQPATCLKVEYFKEGDWISCGTRYDLNQYNKGSSINRCGLYGYASSYTRPVFFDDTEVWVPE